MTVTLLHYPRVAQHFAINAQIPGRRHVPYHADRKNVQQIAE
jgi:hypothetical protein